MEEDKGKKRWGKRETEERDQEGWETIRDAVRKKRVTRRPSGRVEEGLPRKN